MAKFIIKGGNPLKGGVTVSGSKNASLPVLAASLLCGEKCVLYGVPKLSDIENMLEILSDLGAFVFSDGKSISVCGENMQNDCISPEHAGRLRASFLVFGPLLAKTGAAKIALPGGCRIGARPIDLHLKGLSLMGACISLGHGYVEASCKKLHGANIYLDFPSVGATENLIMSAALADGETVIENAAAEPEVADLALFINEMGGRVFGAGTDTVRISGVRKLHGCTHTVIPDRIEAGTFIAAVAMTGGNVNIKNVIPEHIRPVIAKAYECGLKLSEQERSINVYSDGRSKSFDIKTMPYPGFPTDMQAPFSALMSVANGTGIVTETIFENRFMHIPELQRMGASIKTEGRTAVIEGINGLTGADVSATDLRAGAALALAGFCASGTTRIDNIEHIERGYENFAEKFTMLGADIYRVD